MSKRESKQYGCGTLLALIVIVPAIYWIWSGVFRGSTPQSATREPTRPKVWLENTNAVGGWVPVALDIESRDRMLRIFAGNEAGESLDGVKLAKPPHGSLAEILEDGPRASRVIVITGKASGVTGWVPNDRIKR